jgi:trigger factor
VNPASPPHIDSMDEKGTNFIYTLNYEVFPEVDNVKLDDINLEKTVVEVIEEDVDRMLETLRE